MEQKPGPSLRFAGLSAEADRIADEILKDFARGGGGWRKPLVVLFRAQLLALVALFRELVELMRAGAFRAGGLDAGELDAGELDAGSNKQPFCRGKSINPRRRD